MRSWPPKCKSNMLHQLTHSPSGNGLRYLRWLSLLAAVLETAGTVASAGSPPQVTIVQPLPGAAAVPDAESVIVEVRDEAPVSDLNVRYLFNGSPPPKGWVAIGRMDEGRHLRVELAFVLTINEDYMFEAMATDAEGLMSSARIYFDTFDPNRIVIEAEDYNYDSGLFIDSPNLTPEGVPEEYAYWDRTGVAGVDFHDMSSAPGSSNTYRSDDAVGLERSDDFVRQWFQHWGGEEAGIHDYSVAGVRAGEWLEYTRTFGALAFKVRLRQRVEELPLSASVLEQAVTNDTVRSLVPLGVFLNRPNDGLYRTVPLTDGVGVNEVVFRPNGVATVRLRQLTDDPSGEAIAHNFLVFFPVENPGILVPLIAEVRPWPGETVPAGEHQIRAVIVNRDTAVNVSSVVLKLNGTQVEASIEPLDNGVTVSHLATGLERGSTNRIELSFQDTWGTMQTESWEYAISAEGMPRLESAATVEGPYALEPGTAVDLEARTVRVAVPLETRFYRLTVTGESQPLRIESIQVEAGEVVLSYTW
jgi:hypothetical protein